MGKTMDLRQPELSILLPVYNAEQYVERCLETIQRQTYDDFECIIVNDGSTDRSGYICARQAKDDARFTVVHTANRGPASARNTALSLRHGRYVYFVDADDWLEFNAFEEYVKMIRHTEADILANEYSFGKTSFRAQCIPTLLSSREFMIKLLPDRIGSQLWQYVFRSDLWSGVSIPEDYYTIDDMAVMPLIVARAKVVCCTNMQLYHYDVRDDNISTNRANSLLLSLERACLFWHRYEYAVANDYNDCVSGILARAGYHTVGAFCKAGGRWQDHPREYQFLTEMIREHRPILLKNKGLSMARRMAIRFISSMPKLFVQCCRYALGGR